VWALARGTRELCVDDNDNGAEQKTHASDQNADGDAIKNVHGLDVYAQAEQHQSRHNERSRDHRDKRPYIGSDGPEGFVSSVFVKSIHELAFARSPVSSL
jgi:hypothetical protein